MRTAIVLLAAIGMCGCSPSENQRAHEDAEKAKQQSRELARKAEDETRRASQQLNQDLDKARTKIRGALDDTDRPSNDTDHR